MPCSSLPSWISSPEHASDDTDEFMRGPFSIDAQHALSREIVERFGVSWHQFDVPRVDEQLERGDFGEVHAWLREHVYRLGRKLTPAETIERVVGGPIDPEPYLGYLRGKLEALAAT